MSECTHNCSTCGESCAERATPQSLRKAPHPESHIGKVFGVVSGKGGVGKSMVTSQLAVTLHRRGYKISGVETLIITDIYAAREQNVYGISSKDLAERIEGAVYLSDFTQIVDYVSQRVGEGDLVITVGAGNVFQIGEMLLKQGTADENPSKNKITVG